LYTLRSTTSGTTLRIISMEKATSVEGYTHAATREDGNALSSSDRLPTTSSSISDSDEQDSFAQLRSAASNETERVSTGPSLTDEELARTISQRRSYASGHSGAGEDWEQIQRLISRMFGHERKEHSKEEKTRHLGVVWKNLTVKGLGLGAALQPTNGDIFLGLPRLIRRLVTRRGKGNRGGKPSVRTILDDFTVGMASMAIDNASTHNCYQGCVRPGEMLLVLGRPGSGCSTFLKVIGNQRSGYESVDGDVRYGGTDSETMAQNYRSEGRPLSAPSI
jgi:hypothetical protein